MALVALLVVVGFGVFLLGGDRDGRAAAGGGDVAEAGPHSDPGGSAPGAGPLTAVEPVADESGSARADAPLPEPTLGLMDPAALRAAQARRFAGAPGSLRGHVETTGDEPFPTRWTLIVEPSMTLIGKEHAERRELTFEAGEQEFVVPDLPLGGYDVRALADGMNGLRHPVLLDRTNTSPFLNLVISAAGFVEGSVADELGVPLDELEVWLVHAGDGERVSVRTDAIGRYRFDGVRDGEYTLALGHPDSPLLQPKRLQVRAPSLTLDPLVLPELASLIVTAVDLAGNGVEGAEVRGSGTGGGQLEGTTDAEGRVEFRHLPAGRWRIRGAHDDHGQSRLAFDLEIGRPLEQVLWLRR